MNSDDVAKLISAILNRIPAVERGRLYRKWRPNWIEANVEHDEDAISWLREGGSGLITQILRHTDVTNEEFRALAERGLVRLQNPKSKPNPEVRLVAFQSNALNVTAGVPLDQLAIMSTTVLELTLEVATALEPFTKDEEQPVQLYPPLVSVRSGSVEFALGGGSLLAGGVGLAVAATAGLVISPIAIPGAVFLAAMGVVDVSVGWWKKINEGLQTIDEAEGTRRRAAKTEVETPTKEEVELERGLERRRKELAILKLEKELAAMSGMPPAPSSLVSADEVRKQAELWGLSEPACTHVLNRSLPKAIAARRILGPMDAVPSDRTRTKNIRTTERGQNE